MVVELACHCMVSQTIVHVEEKSRPLGLSEEEVSRHYAIGDTWVIIHGQALMTHTISGTVLHADRH